VIFVDGTFGRRAVGPPCGPTPLDGALAALVAAGLLLGFVFGPHGTGHVPAWRDWVAAAVVFALILLRQRRPMTILVVSAAAAIVATIIDGRREGFIAATVIAVYTVASRATRDTASLQVLTDREREMVSHVAVGLSNDDIAERLYLSPSTVKTHINRAMTKLGARDRAQLVVIAYQTGLVRPGDAGC
jgi:DNA-binding CsgD family transcriptional regulator